MYLAGRCFSEIQNDAKGKRKTGHYEIDEAMRNNMVLELCSLLNSVENGSVSVFFWDTRWVGTQGR